MASRPKSGPLPPGGADQAVGLIDEQHAVERGLDGLAHADGGVADIAGDQGGAVGLDQVAALEIAQPVQDLAHETGDRGLAGARVAEEDAMQRRRLGPVAEAGALALGGEHIDPCPDLSLDGGEPDHAVQLRQGAIQRPRTADADSTGGPAVSVRPCTRLIHGDAL